MIHAIRQQCPGISFNKIIINAFPGMAKRERENLIPVVSECLRFRTAIQKTGALNLAHLMDIAGCTLSAFSDIPPKQLANYHWSQTQYQ